MKWAKRRKRSADAGTPDPAAGLDPRAWAVVCESATAAHHGNAAAHVAPLLRYEQEAPVTDAAVAAYLLYLLRYRAAELVGGRPAAADLHALADRYYPAFCRLIRGDQRQLVDTLLTAFELADQDRKVSGGNTIVLGSAALGVLLEHPQAQLTTMRPYLAAWWERNAASFRQLAPPGAGL